ncbi:very short patch repair endonuclease [Desulfovibrio inopinatus]|uniref:very short patch repair endonuclease n=1 Tax=Desulfovibrio inopinatus TaxID=102109 RepID=UPI0005578D0C|nr:very short patch repair endonuclease [Desulfovibrio inopinatus]
MDVFDKEKRSKIMRNIKGKNTSIEIKLRKLIYSLGYRYRLHYASLPGKPDIVFPGRKKVIFIHGCFWHQHTWCKRGSKPKSNLEYWLPKLKKNVERDKKKQEEIMALGWNPLIVWECELKAKNREALIEKITSFLEEEE